MIEIEEFEVFKQFKYEKFVNEGRLFNLSSEPYLDIVLTDYCNSDCGFCIGNLSKNKSVGNKEVYKEKIKWAVDNMNVKEVLLLGGEPTTSTMLFDIIEFCTKLNLNKICITTNGYKLKDEQFRKRLLSSGITNINISLMNTNKEFQLKYNKGKGFLGYEDLYNIKNISKKNNVKVRINSNIWKGNLDTLRSVRDHYTILELLCDSIKFSPLLKVDSFSVTQETNDWVNSNILLDEEYDKLFNSIINHYELTNRVSSINNQYTFGFVRNTLIPLIKTPIILNWNQHGQMMNKVVTEKKINNIKLLTNNELSLSWNKEESDYFIKTK